MRMRMMLSFVLLFLCLLLFLWLLLLQAWLLLPPLSSLDVKGGVAGLVFLQLLLLL